MIEQGPATEDEMVLAFLRAEIDASRYGDIIKQRLVLDGLERRIIDEPNLADAEENDARKELLSFRGYKRRELLFTGFPLDATWRRVVLERRDFQTLRYAKDKTWIDLSDGTRLVAVGARNFLQRADNPDTYQIKGIVEALRNGFRFPELIAAEANTGSLILIEGHSRATAYVIEQLPDNVEALVASSLSMPEWYFY